MRFLARLLFWATALPLGAVIVVFALSNRQDVLLAFWPFEEGLPLPAYAVVLVPLLAGLLAGLLTGLSRRMAAQAKARSLAHRVVRLERRLEAAAAQPSQDDP